MKKISLKNLNLKEVEQLSREQLKNVLGGYTDETTAPSAGCPNVTCSPTPGVGEGNYCANDNKSGKCGYESYNIWGCNARKPC
jgi:natural product precursor